MYARVDPGCGPTQHWGPRCFVRSILARVVRSQSSPPTGRCAHRICRLLAGQAIAGSRAFLFPPCPAARSPPRTAGSFRACRAIDCAPACTLQLPRGARRAPRGPARLAPDPIFLRAARATLRHARRLRPLCHAPPLARGPYKFTTRTRLSDRKGMTN